MDRQLVARKIESLRRCVQRVASHCPESLQDLEESLDLQDIVSLNLTRAVQLTVDIGSHIVADLETNAPATMGETFDALARRGILPADLAERLRKAVGFRNLAIHNYDNINWAIVHVIARHRLQDFQNFARLIGPLLDAPAEP